MAIRWITEADTNEPTDPNSALAVSAASWILYKLTAEKYPGITERVEWYGMRSVNCTSCVADMVENSEFYQNYLTAHGHVWYTTPSVRRIRLRGYPVRDIQSITYQGQVLAPTDYYVENKKYLVRRDGQCWNMNTGLEVTYTSGVNPPEAGRQAAIKLANELILAASDPANCTLPSRVTAVSNQGVDFDMLEPTEFIENGRTGIYEIDLFIIAANPTKAKKKPRVFSVDLPSGTTRM